MTSRSLLRRNERIPSTFDDFFTRPWNNCFDRDSDGKPLSMPAVNISERKDDFLITMAAPGLSKEDLTVNLEGNMLHISSEKEEDTTQEDEKFSRREFSYSSFQRSFELPNEVNQTGIHAEYKDGVLSVVLPKKEEAKEMTIKREIKVL